MNSYVCEFCWKVSFNTKWEMFGHRGRCSKRKELFEAKAFDIEFANDIVNENINVEEFNFYDSVDKEYSIESEEKIVDKSIPNLNDNEINTSAFIEAYENATNAYIARQKDFFSVEELQNLSAGFTKNLNGLRNKADIRIYLEICEFVSNCCLLYTSPSPRDRTRSRMPSSA